MNTNKIYERITDTIIELLEKHKQSNYNSAWYKLSDDFIFARNADTNHIYSGINQLMLQYLATKYAYAYNSWMTFKQLSKLNGKIKKGSKAALVVYKSHLYLDADTGENITPMITKMLKQGLSIEHIDYQKRGYLKGYNVFNISQIENLPQEYYKHSELEQLTEFERNEQAEQLINSTGAIINYSAINSAYYLPGTDEIHLPLRKQFETDANFYGIAFHELGHWSGAKHRLNRDMSGIFGSKEYAYEELIAELNSAYICASLGYESRITDNVAYINSWLSVMKEDKKFIVLAAAQAQKASEFIFEFSNIEQLEIA